MATAASSYYSFPVFDGKSTSDGVVVATESAMLSPATFLFDAKLFPEFNHSGGFVLLSRPVTLWRVPTDDADGEGEGEGSAAREEASFNTTFTLDVAGASVSFVVLLDSFPPLNSKKHVPPGAAAVVDVSALPNATNGVSAVEVGTVSSYGPRSAGVGLNVTITPSRSSAASQLAVRIAYDAAAHRLSVYVDVDDPRFDNNAAALLG